MNKLNLGILVAKKAGDIILSYYGRKNSVYEKSEKDFVLQADLDAEDYIISEISKHFPQDSVLSEEEGDISKNSEYRWVIDPLDGTANFKNNIPYFCVSIGIEYKGEMITSIVFDPISKNLFHAEKQSGAYLNNNRISVSKTNITRDFLFSYSTSNHKKQEIINMGTTCFQNILTHCRAIRLKGSSILDLCNLAQGTFDGLIKVGANYWDFAPGCLIVEEAGGKVTDFENNQWGSKSQNIFATNNQQHKELLKTLNLENI